MRPSLSELSVQESGSANSFSLNIFASFHDQCNLILELQTGARHDCFQRSFALTLLLTDMFSFLQQSIELQKQVLQFISGGRVKSTWHTLTRDQFRPDINY